MAWQHDVKTRWAALGVREQRSLTLAAAVLGLALFWSVLLAPALRTLKSVDAQNAVLGKELERMQALQTRARALQAQPALAPKESLKALQTAATGLGKNAVLQVVGEQATLTLKQVSATALAQWLTPQAGAGLSPLEARLQREGSSTEPLWSGTLVFRLPANANAAP
jgi:general secretion pathway protein M